MKSMIKINPNCNEQREHIGRQFAFQKIFLQDCSDELLLQLIRCRPRLESVMNRDLTEEELKEYRAEDFITSCAYMVSCDRAETEAPGTGYPTSIRDLWKMNEEGWFDDPKPATLRRKIAARQRRNRRLVREFLLREAEKFK
jgi:hypothetical protein